MITGSIYLGKKAKKAYRRRQAEKVAKQLVGPIEIIDPSDELKLTAPPVSPTEKTASPSSTYTNSGTVSADSKDRYYAGSRSPLAPSSTYSSHGQHSALSEDSGNFAQFQGRDLSRIYPLEPPSYDTALHSLPPEHSAVTGYGQFGHAPDGPLRNNEAQSGMGDGCPTCIALMHSHHVHGPPHLYSNAHPLPGSFGPGPRQMRSDAMSPTKNPAAAELPGQMTEQQSATDLGSLQLAEMADTSRIPEMPADVPAEMFVPILAEKVRANRNGEPCIDRVENFPVELPAELEGSR